jgi:hypothetical protein
MPVRRLPLDGLKPEEVEAVVAELPAERLYLYDPDRIQIAIFEGEADWVQYRLNDDERRRIRDGYLVHNHPPHEEFAVDDPRFDQSSYSPLDWQAVVDLNVRSMVLVSPRWRCELGRPHAGWLAVHNPAWHLLEMLNSMYDHFRKEDELLGTLRAGIAEQLRATLSHRVNEVFASEIEATYRREER